MRVFLALVFLWGGTLAAEEARVRAEELIVGAWTNADSNANAVRVTEYLADGNGAQITEVMTPGGRQRLELKFRWEVKDGVVVHTVVGSNVPSQYPEGMKIRWTIIELTADKFVHAGILNDDPGAGRPLVTDPRALAPTTERRTR